MLSDRKGSIEIIAFIVLIVVALLSLRLPHFLKERKYMGFSKKILELVEQKKPTLNINRSSNTKSVFKNGIARQEIIEDKKWYANTDEELEIYFDYVSQLTENLRSLKELADANPEAWWADDAQLIYGGFLFKDIEGMNKYISPEEIIKGQAELLNNTGNINIDPWTQKKFQKIFPFIDRLGHVVVSDFPAIGKTMRSMRPMVRRSFDPQGGIDREAVINIVNNVIDVMEESGSGKLKRQIDASKAISAFKKREYKDEIEEILRILHVATDTYKTKFNEYPLSEFTLRGTYPPLLERSYCLEGTDAYVLSCTFTKEGAEFKALPRLEAFGNQEIIMNTPPGHITIVVPRGNLKKRSFTKVISHEEGMKPSFDPGKKGTKVACYDDAVKFFGELGSPMDFEVEMMDPVFYNCYSRVNSHLKACKSCVEGKDYYDKSCEYYKSVYEIIIQLDVGPETFNRVDLKIEASSGKIIHAEVEYSEDSNRICPDIEIDGATVDVQIPYAKNSQNIIVYLNQGSTLSIVDTQAYIFPSNLNEEKERRYMGE